MEIEACIAPPLLYVIPEKIIPDLPRLSAISREQRQRTRKETTWLAPGTVHGGQESRKIVHPEPGRPACAGVLLRREAICVSKRLSMKMR
ncbi:MAG: hypothetical protein KJ804_21500 [Proteobacteria bacterium]|nr:hypothetical protein [Pseudomonadota bacterium]MBU1060887.1 hypothetical protein [Pseudomonadota bacterium]